MTADELQILLNLRAQLSEYEVFMTQLSTMIARGIDIPCIGAMAFPMREKLYGQVRDLVLGKSAMATEPKFKKGDKVCVDDTPEIRGVVREIIDGALFDKEGSTTNEAVFWRTDKLTKLGD